MSASGMGLDIRHPLGLLFIILGALLALLGLVTGASARSLGYNVNLVWGLCLIVFGVVCLALAVRAKRRERAAAEHAGGTAH